MSRPNPSDFADRVRDLAGEYVKLLAGNYEMADDTFDIEDTEIQLNMFLRWLGAKKPIRDGLGWGNIKKKWVGERNRPLSKIKLGKVMRELRKNPEKMAGCIRIFVDHT